MSDVRDRSLLFGALAIQFEMLDAGRLAAAAAAWAQDPRKPLGEILVEQGALGQPERALLDSAVQRHIDRHGDSASSLTALRRSPGAGEALRSVLSVVGEESLPLFASEAGDLPPPVEPQAAGEGGAVAGRFRVVGPRARGGLGEVFLARDEELGREVALKEIRPEFADQAELRARFVLEARVTGGLEHPGIVPVYGLGCHADGRPFYAMRLIRGECLSEAIARCHGPEGTPFDWRAKSLALRKLLGHFVQVCNAAAYAHSRGVIHRDLKPQNVMLGPYGETLLVDWGLAKVVGRDEPGPEKPREEPPGEKGEVTLPPIPGGPPPTQLGSTIGTLAYMSPEQAAGLVDQLRPASDIYGLGATLYEILTGRPPFQGTGQGQARQDVLVGRFPRPRQVRSGVPRPLEAICLKAMALDPSRRYGSARELADEVEAWLADEPVAAWPEPFWARAGRWTRRHRAAVTGLAATMLVALVSLSIGLALLAAANERVRQSQRETAQREEDARRNFQMARAAVDSYLSRVSEDPRLKAKDLERLRRDLLLTARTFYEQFVQQEPDDPELRFAWGWAHYRLADITAEVSSKREAAELLQKAVGAFSALAAEFPDHAGYQSGLLKARVDLARMHADMGQSETASAELEAVLPLAQRLAEKWPDLPEFQTILAGIHNNRAGLDLESRRTAQAEAGYQAAIAIRRSLLHRHPDVAEYESQLAGSLGNLAVLYRQGKRYPEAARALVEAADIQQRLVDQYRDEARYLSDLATTCDRLAQLYGEQAEDSPQVESALKAALTVRRRLVREHPAVTDYQYELARTQHGLARCYLKSRRLDDARKALDDLLEIYGRLAAEHPDVPDYQRDLASATNNLAACQAEQGRADEAIKTYQTAVQLRQQLVQKHPDRFEYQRELAEAHGRLGAALASGPRRDEAEQAFRAAAGVLESLARAGRHRDAADEARDLAARAGGLSGASVRMAGVLAVAADTAARDPSMPAAERPRVVEEYATSAIGLLEQARAAGYFSEATHRQELAEDSALTSLRDRPDYKELLQRIGLP